MFMESLGLSGNHWLKSTPSHELPTKQNMSTSLFDNFSHIWIISKLHDPSTTKQKEPMNTRGQENNNNNNNN